MAGFEVTTEGSAHRPPESLAESLRRTPDRLDPQGLPRPFRHLQRAASETNPEFIFHLLPRIEDSFKDSTSNVRMFARSRVSERSSRFRTSAACITVTNVRPLNAMPADAFLARSGFQSDPLRVHSKI